MPDLLQIQTCRNRESYRDAGTIQLLIRNRNFLRVTLCVRLNRAIYLDRCNRIDLKGNIGRGFFTGRQVRIGNGNKVPPVIVNRP